MNSRVMVRLTAPIFVLSGLLLASGALTAWYARRIQTETSADLERCVGLLGAAGRLSASADEVQVRLTQFLISGDLASLEVVPTLESEVERSVEEAARRASLQEEYDLIASIRGGCEAFRKQLALISRDDPEAPRAVRAVLERHVVLNLIPPVNRFLDHARQLLETTSASHLQASRRMEIALLVLGICGAAAGVLAGYGVSRILRRSIVELSIPIRDAAGKLNEVVGPFKVPGKEDPPELERSLREIAGRVGEAVEKLHRTQAEALRADQMAAVGQLAAGIAHEILNPLTAIKIIVQAALERGGSASVGGRDLEVIHGEILRLEDSIRNFINFARPPTLDFRPFDARAALEETIALVSKKAARQGVRLVPRLPEGPVTIQGDPAQIRQVMLNLILNALDELPAGGEIGAELEVGPGPSGVVGSPAPGGPGGDRLTIRIWDTGRGLPAGLSDRIFEPFVSTKETGSGLGLSISKRIVESHGGEISAANRPEGGAEFTVRLPLRGQVETDAAGRS